MPADSRTTLALETICDRLSERTATLFLGAGINAGVVDANGTRFPLGNELRDWIARDLLATPGLTATLEDVAEMARHRLDERYVNDYIYKEFGRFRPSTAHLALVQLPWDVIYTTNYDLLVEEAASAPTVKAAGILRSVVSVDTDLTQFTEADILYYKLHGSVNVANSSGGRLVLARDDYRFYELHRKPLFRRLADDLARRTFVFVGYSLMDDDFRAIIEDCRNELGGRALPLSFAVRHSFTRVEEAFWRDKYNIQLVKADSDEFLNSLKDMWLSGKNTVIPLAERRAKQYVEVDATAHFRKVAESFYEINPKDCTGLSDPETFFNGNEPTWADIRDEVPPHRDVYWNLFEALFQELQDPAVPPSLYLISGAAGTGKTTLLHSIGFDIAKSFDLRVLEHIPGTPFEARFIAPLVNADNPSRVVVLLRHAGEHMGALERFMEDAKQRKLPVTILVEERSNQWIMANELVRNRLAPAEFELGALSATEVGAILDALARHNALGKLTGTERAYQEEHFTSLAHKELLVALRELTTGRKFDEIIKDEYEKIPSDVAKEVYKYVAALGQIDVPIRYPVLLRLVDIRADQLINLVFKPAQGILISSEEVGNSRHNAGFRISARHPVIASIIFALVAPDDDAKLRVLNDILSEVDTGYPEDKGLLDAMVRWKALVNTIVSIGKRRAIYDRLERLLPSDPYVLQHRSILERELHAPDRAVEYARRAVQMDRNNAALLNTLGMALEFKARLSNDELLRQATLSEASRLFDDGIARSPQDAYGYIGKVLILKQELGRETDKDQEARRQAEIISLLEEAYEATHESEMIAHELAVQREQLGTLDEAIALVEGALSKAASNIRLRDLYIQLLIQKGHDQRALEVAQQGVKFDPTSWRLQRHIARLLRRSNHPADAVKGHYQAAIRHHKGDVGLMVELGAYLFRNGLYPDARAVFSEAASLPYPATTREKRLRREWWKDENGGRKVFRGTIKAITGGSATVLAIPENFEVSLLRTDTDLSALRPGDTIEFYVGFNAYGTIANLTRPQEDRATRAA